MKVLVTGANGQLGRELLAGLARRRPGSAEGADIAELDVCDGAAVQQRVKNGGYTHIVNCAAYTNVDRCESDPLAWSVNVDGPENLAMAAEASGARMIHISSDYVYDGQSAVPYNETDEVCPVSAYGRQKAESELRVRAACPKSVVIRTQWLYSPYGHNFVKTILERLRAGEPLRVVDDQRGTPTLAFDLASAVADILLAPEWVPGIYHYSDGGDTSWYGFARAIGEEAGISGDITPVATGEYATAARRPPYSVLSKQKIVDTYGVAVPPWRQSLKSMLNAQCLIQCSMLNAQCSMASRLTPLSESSESSESSEPSERSECLASAQLSIEH